MITVIGFLSIYQVKYRAHIPTSASKNYLIINFFIFEYLKKVIHVNE